MPVPFTPHDLPRLAALQPEDWPPIVPPFEAYLSQDFAHPHKIENGSDMAAVGSIIRFGRSAWLAQIITHRDHRGKGLGSRMVGHLLALGAGHGVRTTSLIATAQGEPLYLRHGFVREVEYQFYASPTHVREPKQILPKIRPAGVDDHPAILALDAMVSGEDRRAVLTPHLAGTHVVDAGGSIAGFWMPGLREGLVVALDTGAGRALLAAKAKAGGRMVLPVSNLYARDWVEALGYTPDHTAWRMVRGPKLDWNPTLLWSRIAGKLG